MAPVEPSFLNSNAGPLAQIYAQVAVSGTLLAIIGGNISNAHRNLPPAQHTRNQHKLHRRGITIFATLALVGLVLSAYFAVARRVLSYRRWAEQGGEHVPGTLWTGWYTKVSDGTLIPKEQSVWQLGRWMQDTSIWQEGNEVAVHSSKAWWWTQQQLAANLAFSAFVGLESRRRNMPSFTIISFTLLSSLVSLSVAQNLFYIALLLTPDTPGGASSRASHDPLWAPYNGIQALSSVLPAILLLLTPHFPSAVPLLVFQRWVVPLLRANLPNILPRGLGRTYSSATIARRAYTPLFSVLAIFAFIMHAKQTLLALNDHVPAKYRSHFNFIWGTHDTEQYSSFTRAGMAAGRVLDVLHTHPAVSATAWDVLLSAASFCIYAGVRGLDPRVMLKCSLAPWLKFPSHSADEDATPEPAASRQTSSSNKSKSARKQSASSAITSGAEAITNAVKSPQKRKASSGRRRGRSDSSDEDRLAKVSTANIIDDAETPAASTRRSMRIKNADRVPSATSPYAHRDEEDDDSVIVSDVDESYIPTPATQRAVSKVVHGASESLHGLEGAEAAGEAAALGWGLFVLGGLGVLSSAVLGADC